MSKALIASAVLLASTGQAQSPIEPHGYGSTHDWFCGVVSDWKALMRRKYPHVDRSMPEIERRCHLPREASR